MNEIYRKYYSLQLDRIVKTDKRTNNIYIKDKCSEMPKDKAFLQIESNTEKKEIHIDLSCNNFYYSNFTVANHLKKFIIFVVKMIRSKPQIRNAPQSDIMYM